MQTHEAVGRRAPAGRIRFLALTRPEWLMALVLVLSVALAAWLAFTAGSDPLDGVALDEPAVPVLAPAAPTAGRGAVPAGAVLTEAPPATEAGRPLSGAAQADAATVSVRPLLGGTLAANPFDEYRLERERMRSRQAEALEAMVRDPSAGDEVRRGAQQRLLALWESEAREAQLESVLRAQGFDALVIVTDAGAHVVVDAVLDAAQAQRIGELVSRMAGVRREAVSIVDAVSAGR
ncbi:MAG TPA: SpoIIIAH-like family protein [Limnochordales bacterium]